MVQKERIYNFFLPPSQRITSFFRLWYKEPQHMKYLILALAVFLVLSSCTKDPIRLEEEQFLIFGTYSSFCLGNCTSLFKLENGQVFADDLSVFYPGEELKFEEVALSDAKYQLSIKAFEDLPENLLAGNEKSFGCPGCLDQDVIFLRYYDGMEVREWQLDTDPDVLPDYLKDYSQEIVEIVKALLK